MKKLAYFMSKVEHYLIFDSLNFPQCGSFSFIQSFHSVSSQELDEEGDHGPQNLLLPPWSRHFYICLCYRHISSLPQLKISFILFFSPQNLQNKVWPFILKLPVTICNHFMCNLFNLVSQVMLREVSKVSWGLWSCKGGPATFWTEFCTIIVFSTLKM